MAISPQELSPRKLSLPIPPVLKTTGVASNYLVVNKAAETLTVTFSEAITIKNPALIVVKKSGINLTGAEVTSKEVNKATIVITL